MLTIFSTMRIRLRHKSKPTIHVAQSFHLPPGDYVPRTSQSRDEADPSPITLLLRPGEVLSLLTMHGPSPLLVRISLDATGEEDRRA